MRKKNAIYTPAYPRLLRQRATAWKPSRNGFLGYNRRSNSKAIQKKPKEAFEVKGAHEAIIGDVLWQQVRGKRVASDGRKEKVDYPEHVSHLSGFVKCPACGNGLIATKNKGVNRNKGGYYKTLYYYSCRNHRKSAGRTCNFSHAYNQEKVDVVVYEIVSNLGNHPMLGEALTVATSGTDSVESCEKRMKDIRKALYHQEHEKNRLGAELDNLDVLSNDYDSEYDRIRSTIFTIKLRN